MKLLENNKKDILKKFIERFIEKRGNKRAHRRNEIEYIESCINRILGKYFKLSITKKEILEVFEEMGYDVFGKKSVYDPEEKEFKPSKSGTQNRGEKIYSFYDADFIYVDIEPKTLQLLVRTVYTSLNIVKEKNIEVNDNLRREIEQFRKSIEEIF